MSAIEKSIGDLDKLAELAPHPEGFQLRGFAKYMIKDYEGAMEDLAASNEMRPDPYNDYLAACVAAAAEDTGALFAAMRRTLDADRTLTSKHSVATTNSRSTRSTRSSSPSCWSTRASSFPIDCWFDAKTPRFAQAVPESCARAPDFRGRCGARVGEPAGNQRKFSRCGRERHARCTARHPCDAP